ncbi:FGGY family carbohydrate kinase [Cohnella thailandensis]|uniref:ATP:glycerol 3-phosphotransferase n=1 Tax=Cohnella thailandensis TaxID=557557 RepID=A0A841T018_9BACL|nr:glycerol kinase [Cohnella thailandensis]MBB6637783.1 glycerol kinase [Cohnella thailandensis]MBP1974039.1 glycerol kinase [Cohnella thailandensis]
MSLKPSPEKDYILAIDQSTSGTKALLVDRSGEVAARCSLEHKQFYPRPGWVEHDALEIYGNVRRAARAALESAGVGPERLAALTVTNQRETAVLWDRTTGLPVHRAIVWQCQRTAERCAELREAGWESAVREKTGLLLDPYFSAAKWSWMLENVPNAKRKLAAGELLAGTVDSWLIWKLTGGRVHATDYTNASRTSLYNIHTLEWDEELCALFGVPDSVLPEVKFSDELFGHAEDPELFGDARVPISGVIGDSQAALFGNGCLKPGTAKATYGTGTSVLMNVGERPAPAGSGLVQAIAWGRGGKITYALEAVIRTSGDSIKWVRDNLGLFADMDEMQKLLDMAPENEGVYLVPAFVGLGAPYWQPDARAALVGMNRGTGRAQVVRAAIESIAYQVRDAVELLEGESGIPLKELRADGGASANAVLMQFQADMLGRAVFKSDVAELSAMGSVYLGGLGAGFWSSLEEAFAGANAGESGSADARRGHLYEPAMAPDKAERQYAGWKRAVASVIGAPENRLA